jgi:hypothetical protein
MGANLINPYVYARRLILVSIATIWKFLTDIVTPLIEVNKKKLNKFLTTIRQSLVQSALSRDRFVFKDKIQNLMTIVNVKPLLPGASLGLVEFIYQDRKKLFLTVA